MELKDIKTASPTNHAYSGLSLIVLVGLLCCLQMGAFAQATVNDTLKLNRQQYEELFLKQNLLLLAEKFKIDQAEAMVVQAKLWPNPNLSIEEVNLWATDKQLSYLEEPLPPVFGDAAKNTQFSVVLEQQIITAGKRKKQIQLEEVGVQIAQQEFELLLRQLKYDFRNLLTELQYLQLYNKVFFKQRDLIKNLLNAYKKQYENDHISKGDYIRLQTLQFELSKDINELLKEKNEKEKELKILLSLTGANPLFVLEDDFDPNPSKFKNIRWLNMSAEIMEQRPDVKLSDLETQHFKNLLSYEKAQALPDVSFSASYDRGGGVWPNFFGFGLSIDLPFFDRNQGAISYARLGIENASLRSAEVRVRAEAELNQVYKDFSAALEFYDSIDPDFEEDLDEIFESYTRNFANRNISLLQYLDFQEAYLENKRIILEAKKSNFIFI